MRLFIILTADLALPFGCGAICDSVTKCFRNFSVVCFTKKYFLAIDLEKSKYSLVQGLTSRSQGGKTDRSGVKIGILSM